ncbi:Xanthine phosphoribosyltransferase 1 [Linnemannia exigua]|uniref:Xanthine phosphoribosyltransferase 1 n=1 Tax=Linnemannia exigua TaxID=604196 RepID=A0AAD4DG39_9FUNG|nr:Xanthine phosphoribosyltransferase 1 [Linnemannia exigua]
MATGQERLQSLTTWIHHQWARFKMDAVNKIMYTDDGIDETLDTTDIHGRLDLEVETTETMAKVHDGELDDIEEDPTYYIIDPVRPRDMPSWFSDWLVNKTLHPSTLYLGPSADLELTTDNNVKFATNTSDSSSQRRPRRPAMLDIVYTWVNGSDPEWKYSKHHYVQQDPTLLHINADDKAETKMAHRFRDNNEMIHSLRSTYKFGRDMVRKIHIATADMIEETLWKSMHAEEADGAIYGGNNDVQEDSRNKETKKINLKAPTGPITNREVNSTSGRSATPMLQKRSRPGFDAMFLNALKIADEVERRREATEAAEEIRNDMFIFVDQDAALRPFVPKFIFLNDDIYFGMPMVQADYWTPQYGLVFQVVLDRKVRPIPTLDDKKSPLALGYDDNLKFANYQLSKRFGYRFRPQIAHIVQVASRSILEEAEALWPEAFVQSEMARFRSSFGGQMLRTMFLMAHYTIERLRETQLRSFWRYRVDYNGNGVLEWEERWALVALIKNWTKSGSGVNHRRVETSQSGSDRFLQGHDAVLDRTGYREPEQSPAVRYAFSGMEGFPFLIPQVDTSLTIDITAAGERVRYPHRHYNQSVKPADRICRFNLEFCLGPKFLTRHGTLSHKDGEKVFKRLAFREFHCGDCLLQIALQSDRGVDYYNERVEDAEDDCWGDRVPLNPPPRSRYIRTNQRPLQQHKSRPVSSDNFDTNNTHDERRQEYDKTKAYSQHHRWIRAILPHESTHPTARTRILQDLYRYNYVIGESDSYFGMIENLDGTKRHFNNLREARQQYKLQQCVCLNDDVKEEDKDAAEMRGMLAGFLGDWFGESSPWEKQ